jgi:hypothetical protein
MRQQYLTKGDPKIPGWDPNGAEEDALGQEAESQHCIGPRSTVYRQVGHNDYIDPPSLCRHVVGVDNKVGLRQVGQNHLRRLFRNH